MGGIAILIGLSFLLALLWMGYHFGYTVLDAFSPVRNEYGVIAEKEYIPPRSKIVTKRVVRTHEDFDPTSYDTLEEVELPEKCILHIKLNGQIVTTPVTGKMYDSVNRDDSVLVRYSRGRFSKNIYLKKVERL